MSTYKCCVDCLDLSHGIEGFCNNAKCTCHTPQESWVKELKTFCNEVAFQLKPSNDTMEAVRLFRKDLTGFVEYVVTTTEERARKEAVETGYKLAVRHLKEMYQHNLHTTVEEAIEWLDDNSKYTPTDNNK